jgi:Type VI secretion system (T6SS), amidase immunity protein
MALRIIKTIVLVVLTGCSVLSAHSAKYTPKEYYKNYALSTCIADGVESNEVAAEAAAAARGYLELGTYPLEAYTEATLLGREFLKKEYKSMSGAKLTIMKCIDFYHSQELEALANKYESTEKK